MFLVFKQRKIKKIFYFELHLLLVIWLLFLSQNSKAENNMDTLSIFHYNESPIQIIDSFQLKEQNIRFYIFFKDQKEPYSKPIAIDFFYQCGEQAISKVNRKLNGEERTYCDYAEPLITNDSLLGNSKGQYLVLPLGEFDESKQVCMKPGESFETFPINSFMKLCQKF